jgi:hypothetical protein
MSIRWEQQAFQPVADERVADSPCRRVVQLDAGDIFPVTTHLGPIIRPRPGVIAPREIDNALDIDAVGDKRRRWSDRRRLAVLRQRCFGLEREVKSFDTGTVEPAAVHCGTGSARRQMGPIRRMESMENRIRTDPDWRQPLAPLRRSSR